VSCRALSKAGAVVFHRASVHRQNVLSAVEQALAQPGLPPLFLFRGAFLRGGRARQEPPLVVVKQFEPKLRTAKNVALENSASSSCSA